MATEGIEAVFMETHNWGKAARFFQSLGYELEFDTGHNSGQLRKGDSPTLFIAEIPADRAPGLQLVLKVTDAERFVAESDIALETPFEETHFGTRMAAVRDPDGRTWGLQAPVPSGDTN